MPIVHPRPSAVEAHLGPDRHRRDRAVLGRLRRLDDRPAVPQRVAGFRFTMEAISYLAVVTFLTFSALMYLLARQGALLRFRDHLRVPRGLLDRHFARPPRRTDRARPVLRRGARCRPAHAVVARRCRSIPTCGSCCCSTTRPFPTDPAVAGPARRHPRARRRHEARSGGALARAARRFDRARSSELDDHGAAPPDVARGLADAYEPRRRLARADGGRRGASHDHVDGVLRRPGADGPRQRARD